MDQSGKQLFEAAEADIQAALKLVAFRRRLNPSDFDDLKSFVWLKLIDNDYARLRKHSGEGSMRAYLSVVVQRLYLDYKVWCFGKWHPSAEAIRRGDVAIELERLIYRDGFEPREAVAFSAMRRCASAAPVSEDELWELASALPVRQRPRHVSEDTLNLTGVGPTEDSLQSDERQRAGDRLHTELRRAFASLDAFDRKLLELRYREECTIPEIAARLGVNAKPLYARVRRLLRRVRARLEQAGLGADEAIEVVLEPCATLDLEGVFSPAAA